MTPNDKGAMNVANESPAALLPCPFCGGDDLLCERIKQLESTAMSYKHGERIDINWYSEPNKVTPEYIKGHVTESEARAALEAHERGYGEGPMTLRHIYGRWVFCEGDEYNRAIHIYTEPKHGSFKLTEVRLINYRHPDVAAIEAMKGPR